MNKEKTIVKDMTVGTPWKLMLQFAVPLMLGNVFQQVYTFTDTLVVGQVLGMRALAAIGVTEWVIFLMFATIQGIVQGFSIIVSQSFGAGDYSKMRSTICNGIYLILGMMLVFTIVGQLMIQPILGFLCTPDEIVGLATDYLRVLYLGIPFVFVYNYLAAILRAIGNSKIPLQAVILSSIENISLDIVFVYCFEWGMKGAALATVVSIATSAIYCLYRLREFELLHSKKFEWKLNTTIMKEQVKLGCPMGLQNIITSLGGLIVQSVVNSFGVLFIAGYTAANKLYGLLEIAASSYGYAMNTYVGQNKGAGKAERLQTGLVAGNLIGVLTACTMSVIMILFGKPILGCFLSGSVETVREAMKSGYQFLIVLALGFPCLYVLYIVRAWIQGMGNSTWPMISSFVQLAMRVGCAILLSHYIGEQALYFGEVAAWIGADILLYLVYRSYKKRKFNVLC